jgi:hypothetical protein
MADPQCSRRRDNSSAVCRFDQTTVHNLDVCRFLPDLRLDFVEVGIIATAVTEATCTTADESSTGDGSCRSH